MKEQELFDRIRNVSQNAEVKPSEMLWDRLAERLDSRPKVSAPPPKTFQFLSWQSLAIAASVLVLIGAYAMLNNLNNGAINSTAIQLEDLHTLEVNPKYNIPAAGDAATIPSIRNAKVVLTSYKTIEEGSPSKELIQKQTDSRNAQESGLG